MNQVTLEFESADLAGWLWGAVAVLVIVELVRYVLAGRRPARRAARGIIMGVVAVALAALVISDCLRLDASTHRYACLALGGFASVWLIRSYARTTRAITPAVRAVLLVLRLLAAAVVLAIAAGPVLQQVQIIREKPVLGIAIDDSRSMSIRDALPAGQANAPEPTSRTAAVRAALDAALPVLNRLSDQVQLAWFTFDAEVKPTVWPALLSEGSATALADAVRQVHTLLGRTRHQAAGVIVISDGRDNFSAGDRPEAVAATLAAAGTPLYTVGTGSDVPIGQTRSLQARRLDVPDRIAVANRLPVHAEFVAAGLAGTSIDVEFLIDGTPADSRRVQPRQGHEVIEVQFEHVPTEPGLHRVTVRARTSAIEKEPSVAELSQFVQVTEDRIDILYVDRPRYERVAIGRALAAAQELRVTQMDLNRPAAFRRALTEGDSGPAWQRYRVVLIGDVDPSDFPVGGIEAIRDLVSVRGRGLAMLGGLRTLGSGRYGDSALAEVVPVDLAATGQDPSPLRCELTPAGRVHPACRLDPDPSANSTLWARLPPLAGASRLAGLKPAAEILLKSDKGDPLLVVREAGKGRTAVVAFDSTWQWSFVDEKGLDTQRRFWRQLVLWLANRQPEVWVTTDRPRYDLARLRAGTDRMLVRAGLADPNPDEHSRPPTLTATLTVPSGQSRQIQFVTTPQGREAKLTPETAGDYRIEVVAQGADGMTSRAQAAFTVTSADQELAEPLADLQTLKRMADQTRHIGGSYVPISELSDLLGRIAASSHTTEIRRTRRWHLVQDHPWPWLLVFTAALTLEWIIRRRAGLV